MPLVDVMDDTFVRAEAGDVRGRTGTSWAAWLPDLDLAVVEDRAEKGLRWSARTSARAGTDLAGSAEVWLEPVPGGTVAHLYVRLDPVSVDPVRVDPVSVDPVSVDPLRPDPVRARAGRGGARRARRLPDRLRVTWKRGLHAFKDGLEGERTT